MKIQNRSATPDTQKTAIIRILFITSVLIMVSGVYFSIYSLIYHMNFMVLKSSIHGAFIGLLVLYLGIRYFISVKKLKVELYKTTSVFSWSNFKKDKKNS